MLCKHYVERQQNSERLAQLRSGGTLPPDIQAQHRQLAQRLAQLRQDPRMGSPNRDAALFRRFEMITGKKLAAPPAGKLIRRNSSAWGAASRSSFRLTTRDQSGLLPPTADAPGDQTVILGCAVPYGRVSGDLGGFREMYAPGCFGGSLNKNLAMLFNHSPALVLGRTESGTAAFHNAPDGLWSACVPPDTTWARDLIVSMQRGDISEMSAAFLITKSHWENRNGQKVNVIDEGDLLECSVVSFAAYGKSTTAVLTDETDVDANFLAIA